MAVPPSEVVHLPRLGGSPSFPTLPPGFLSIDGVFRLCEAFVVGALAWRAFGRIRRLERVLKGNQQGVAGKDVEQTNKTQTSTATTTLVQVLWREAVELLLAGGAKFFGLGTDKEDNEQVVVGDHELLEMTEVNVLCEEHKEKQDVIATEMLVRNIQFYGEDGQARVENSFVVVVGVGGVGSHCAVALARSGVRRIRLIDFDMVSLSSLNRHACSAFEDVGSEKVLCVRDFIRKINPRCEVDARQALFSIERADELILDIDIVDGDVAQVDSKDVDPTDIPDFVVDCIDNLPTKCDLIQYCQGKNIPLIVSAGMAAKADPTKLRVGPLTDTAECELAKRVRQELRLRNNRNTQDGDVNDDDTGDEEVDREVGDQEQQGNDRHGAVDEAEAPVHPTRAGPQEHPMLSHVVDLDLVPVVYSVERTARALMPLKEHQNPENAKDFAPLENFRVRTLPVTAPVPACAGYTLAGYVLCELAGQPMVPDQQREPLKTKTWRRFLEKAKMMLPQEAHWVKPEQAEGLLYDVYKRRGCLEDTRGAQLQLVPIDVEMLKRIKAGQELEDSTCLEGGDEQQNQDQEESSSSSPHSPQHNDDSEEELNLFDMEVAAEDLEKPRPKFYSEPANWILVNKTEASAIVRWFNGRNWDGPLPPFFDVKKDESKLKNIDRVLSLVEQAGVEFGGLNA
ncbi:unnamed protein product [Amoebophrya sp. A25]|nr:unnamed protein product [Amoebophrya sp. A25]|eukprot:GSA25T00010107001.1